MTQFLNEEQTIVHDMNMSIGTTFVVFVFSCKLCVAFIFQVKLWMILFVLSLFMNNKLLNIFILLILIFFMKCTILSYLLGIKV